MLKNFNIILLSNIQSIPMSPQLSFIDVYFWIQSLIKEVLTCLFSFFNLE